MPDWRSVEDREHDTQEWAVQKAITEHEESGGAWRDRFARQAAEQPAQHWPDDTTDRRWFTVDGDLEEQDRRDTAPGGVSLTPPGPPA